MFFYCFLFIFQTAEIITLLYVATQGPPDALHAPMLNPTGGVKVKPQPPGLDYKKDPSRPGGGVFIAHGEARKTDYKDLPKGVVITSSSEEESSEGEDAPAKAGAVRSDESGNINDRERTLLLSSSAFAPPLPDDDPAAVVRSPSSSSSAPRRMMRLSANANASGVGGASASVGGGQPSETAQHQQESSSNSLVNFTPLGGRDGDHGNGNVNPAMNMHMNSQTTGGHVMDVSQGAPNLAEFPMADSSVFLDGIPGGMFDWGAFPFLSSTGEFIFFRCFQDNGTLSFRGLLPPVRARCLG